LVHAVHLVEVLLELVGRGGEELPGLADLIVGLVCAFSKGLEVGDLEALTHKGVTDSLDLVSTLAHRLEDNEVSDLLDIVLLEGSEVGECLSSGGSEEHLSHSF
jgi:hypothetical protein